jgi:hypothetical protein
MAVKVFVETFLTNKGITLIKAKFAEISKRILTFRVHTKCPSFFFAQIAIPVKHVREITLELIRLLIVFSVLSIEFHL